MFNSMMADSPFGKRLVQAKLSFGPPQKLPKRDQSVSRQPSSQLSFVSPSQDSDVEDESTLIMPYFAPSQPFNGFSQSQSTLDVPQPSTPASSATYPPVEPHDRYHTCLCESWTPLLQGPCPPISPKPDIWDSQHVKLPCSPSSLYYHALSKTKKMRWRLIKEALSRPIRSASELQRAILSYNVRYSEEWKFDELARFCRENVTEGQRFFATTLPRIIALALQLPDLITAPIPLLSKQRNHAISMSQQQAACLLANAFLCSYPRRTSTGRNEYKDYPTINFNRLFATLRGGVVEVAHTKIRCLLAYFEAVTTNCPSGVITYRRQVQRSPVDWASSTKPLQPFDVFSDGTIEDNGIGMLQVSLCIASLALSGDKIFLGRFCQQDHWWWCAWARCGPRRDSVLDLSRAHSVAIVHSWA
eukprot:m.77138 g.77138  ORF g.77138 m.77138 type:complete len:416 (+) comp14455_c0_seq1:2-1249(+)